jgi:glyoxylase-like metal-dependent hydrolase (beta-lactamase superfamily II)
MKIETFAINPFQMNCYVYYDETSGEGVLIDPGAYTHYEKNLIEKYVQSNKIKINLILNTHGHIDHIMGNAWAKEVFKVPILMHKDDLPLIGKATEQGKLFGVEFPAPPEPDELIDEESEIRAGKAVFKVLYTPGHSPGSVCFADEKAKLIIVGDTLFRGSIGRTDLWMGDMDVLLNSITDKLLQYPNDYTIYPGHYEETTIGEEKKYNPFLITGIES